MKILKRISTPTKAATVAKRTVNKQWHETHKMPKHPTLQQRVDWHLEHAKNCGCRAIPGTVLREMEKRGMGQ